MHKKPDHSLTVQFPRPFFKTKLFFTKIFFFATTGLQINFILSLEVHVSHFIQQVNQFNRHLPDRDKSHGLRTSPYVGHLLA